MFFSETFHSKREAVQDSSSQNVTHLAFTVGHVHEQLQKTTHVQQRFAAWLILSL